MYLPHMLPRSAKLYSANISAPRGGTVTLRCTTCRRGSTRWGNYTWSSNYFQISAQEILVFMAICPNCHGYNYRTAGDGPQTQKKGVILVRSFRD